MTSSEHLSLTPEMKDQASYTEEQALAKAASLLREAKAWQDYARSLRQLHEVIDGVISDRQPAEKKISPRAKRTSKVGDTIVKAIRTVGRFVSVQHIADVIEAEGGNLTNLQITKALWRLKTEGRVLPHPKSTHYKRKTFTWGLPDFMDKFATDDKVMDQHEPDEA